MSWLYMYHIPSLLLYACWLVIANYCGQLDGCMGRSDMYQMLLMPWCWLMLQLTSPCVHMQIARWMAQKAKAADEINAQNENQLR